MSEGIENYAAGLEARVKDLEEDLGRVPFLIHSLCGSWPVSPLFYAEFERCAKLMGLKLWGNDQGGTDGQAD